MYTSFIMETYIPAKMLDIVLILKSEALLDALQTCNCYYKMWVNMIVEIMTVGAAASGFILNRVTN